MSLQEAWSAAEEYGITDGLEQNGGELVYDYTGSATQKCGFSSGSTVNGWLQDG